MNEREMATHLYQAFQITQLKTYSECVKMGMEAIRVLKSLSNVDTLLDNNRELINEINTKISNNLMQQVAAVSSDCKEMKMFTEFLNALSSPLDKNIMSMRYLYGYKWRDIVVFTEKAECSVMRHHKSCIMQYIEWRKNYDCGNGTKEL